MFKIAGPMLLNNETRLYHLCLGCFIMKQGCTVYTWSVNSFCLIFTLQKILSNFEEYRNNSKYWDRKV